MNTATVRRKRDLARSSRAESAVLEVVARFQRGYHTFKEGGSAALANKIIAFAGRQHHRIEKRLRKPRISYKDQEPWAAQLPLVSVVIPCYNYGRFLATAIESVLAQTFQNFEILVINDGSTDEMTNELLTSCSFDKTTIIHQENRGLSETRNRGAEMAMGKYVCYVDADDTIEPTYLEKTVNVLERDESIGSCYSWVQCFGSRDSVWKPTISSHFHCTNTSLRRRTV